MNKQNKLMTIFLTLILAGAWTGQSILDLGFVGLMLIWIVESFKTYKANPNLKWKALGLRKSGADWLFLIYFILACLGYVFSTRVGAQPFKYLPRFSTILQIYILMWTFERLTVQPKALLKSLAIATVFPAVYSIVLWISVSIDTPYYRTVGIINSSIQHAIIGGFLAVLFGSVYFKEFSKLMKKEKLIYGFSFLLILIAIVMTRTRTAMIVFVFTAGLFCLSYFTMKLRVGLVLLGSLVAVAFWFSPYKQLVLRVNSDVCRVQLYKVHFRMIEDKPLLGIGYLDNYRDMRDYWPDDESLECMHEREKGVHAHNQYVNVAATTGIPALIVFLSFFIYFIVITVRLIKSAKNSDTAVLALTALLAQIYFMLSGMAEVPFEFAKIRMLILLIWAWVAVTYTKVKAYETKNRT